MQDRKGGGFRLVNSRKRPVVVWVKYGMIQFIRFVLRQELSDGMNTEIKSGLKEWGRSYTVNEPYSKQETAAYQQLNEVRFMPQEDLRRKRSRQIK